MFSSQILTRLNILSSPNSSNSISYHRTSRNLSSSLTIPNWCCCSVRSQEILPVEIQNKDEASSLSSEIDSDERKKPKDELDQEFPDGIKKSKDELKREFRDEKGISGIRVPRQRYISISKTELLDALLSMFESQEDIDEFLRLSS